jgi:amino acid transporter
VKLVSADWERPTQLRLTVSGKPGDAGQIMLYGAALMLEFVTLVALRIREPNLRREFCVPGGMAGAVTCGIFPFALLILATVESEHESILGMNGLVFGVLIILAGVGLYAATRKLRARQVPEAEPEYSEEAA